jgi:3-phenylpropionate/cinnamic acid dioxygenase small subunit
MTDVAVTPVTSELHFEISQFLIREARLLDDRQFEEWLTMLADDITYVAPVRTARMPREQHKEFEPIGGGAHYDENGKEHLAERVRKLATGRAWSDVPMSRTRHLITNIEVTSAENPDAYDVRSNFLVYRTRSTTYQDTFAGERRDRIRRRSAAFGDLEVASRLILLDQTVVLGNNLTVFL